MTWTSTLSIGPFPLLPSARDRVWAAVGRSRLCAGFLLACGFLILPGPAAYAQGHTLEDQLRHLALENAERYVQPVTEGLGYALNGGLFDTARAMRPLRFDLSVRVFGALPPREVRRFETVRPDSIRISLFGMEDVTYHAPYRPREGDGTTPSVAGDGPGAILEPAGAFRDDLIRAGHDPDDYLIPFPDGLGLTVIPYAVAQLAVGVGAGSEVLVRFLPSFDLGRELGQARTVGWGVKHTVSHWLALPIDLSVQAGYQSVKIGDYLDGSVQELGILAGRTFGPLSVYGSAGARRSSAEIRYRTANPEGIPGLPEDGALVSLRSGLDSALAMSAGFRLQLLLLNLSGQMSVGDYDTFSLKVGLGIP